MPVQAMAQMQMQQQQQHFQGGRGHGQARLPSNGARPHAEGQWAMPGLGMVHTGTRPSLSLLQESHWPKDGPHRSGRRATGPETDLTGPATEPPTRRRTSSALQTDLICPAGEPQALRRTS